ncbi:hypothetical protein GCM10010967_31700 [Dyadobacter beijingensis]|uniref:Uncharacterized protein n=1 Tax=Dyadobacter beijingensis TaxID=365489 RepID=A0ABQ2HZ39_9BACT|nr:hypothetical protein [Dyadobacter beijingensis]GGM95852.1 hypothetical protein GCM10010967_31700 [Dyadobacter beijingensis]
MKAGINHSLVRAQVFARVEQGGAYAWKPMSATAGIVADNDTRLPAGRDGIGPRLRWPGSCI